MRPKEATEVDQTIGARITAMRRAKGLSQNDLGIAVGVTFQQIQKYEKGINRVGAGRLQQIAQCLDVPVATLFEDNAETAEQPQDLLLLGTPGAVTLLKAFAEIENDELRRNVLAIVRNVARASTRPTAEDEGADRMLRDGTIC
jgi:transcriptional regulator with XRE-family HTH domain